ncbi:MAG: hypothetical protein Q4B47_05105 [Eubacteriales bacterium]|nr:hypothetical protein [Eubacteriales bacterium]
MNYNELIANTVIGCSSTFLRVDTYKELVYVIKYRGELSPNPETPQPCQDFLDNLLDKEIIFSEDHWKFFDFRYLQELVEYCKVEKNISSRIFRRQENGNLIWSRLEVMIPFNHSEEHPDVLIYIHDIDSADATIYDSFATYTLRLYKLFKVSFQTMEMTVIQEPYREREYRIKAELTNYYLDYNYAAEHYVHPEDKHDFLEACKPERIINYYATGNESYTFYYRHKLGSLYHWVRILVLPINIGSDNTQSFFFYVEDFNKETVQMLDLQNLKIFSQYYNGLSRDNIDRYYQNMMTVLYGFTQEYVDFYMVDLEKDLYIKYKFHSGTLKEAIPAVAPYSESSIRYIKEHCTGQQAEMLSKYCTSEKLREAMRDRLTLEYDFFSDDGVKIRTICQKIESVNGTPTKIIARSIVVHDKDQLKIKTFGNFEAIGANDEPIRFTRKQSKQLLAYLVDRQGYPVTSKDIVADILEKPANDLNAIKYCSTLIRRAMTDLENAGYPNVIIHEQKTVRINTAAIDCDYYHLLNGELSYLLLYHNEYMKEYSWAESTNAEIMSMVDK